MMSPEQFAEYINERLEHMTQGERLTVLNLVIDDFCPKCGVKNQPGNCIGGGRCRCSSSHQKGETCLTTWNAPTAVVE